MSWFIFALISILFWSGSDFFSKLGSPEDDRLSHWKMVFFVGITMGVHALYMITAGGVRVTLRDFLVYLPASCLYILSMIIGYAGLRYIELSISSPVCNSSGAVTAVLCALFLGQRMDVLQLGGVILVTLGIIALRSADRETEKARKEADPEYSRSSRALMYPLLYCLIDGLGTFADAWLLDGHIAEDAANTAYELTFLIMAVYAWFHIRYIRGEKNVVSAESLRRLEMPKIAAALCETAGQFAYVYALSGNAIIAAPMISAYCVLAVIWSRIFLGEKLDIKQYAAIATAVAGIIILGFGDA